MQLAQRPDEIPLTAFRSGAIKNTQISRTNTRQYFFRIFPPDPSFNKGS